LQNLVVTPHAQALYRLHKWARNRCCGRDSRRLNKYFQIFSYPLRLPFTPPEQTPGALIGKRALPKNDVFLGGYVQRSKGERNFAPEPERFAQQLFAGAH
jgi:hypothetical protein